MRQTRQWSWWNTESLKSSMLVMLGIATPGWSAYCRGLSIFTEPRPSKERREGFLRKIEMSSLGGWVVLDFLLGRRSAHASATAAEVLSLPVYRASSMNVTSR